MSSEDERAPKHVNDFVERKIDRRQFLQRSAALGLTFGAASALLAACGGDEEAAPPAEPAPAEPAPAEPTPPAEPAATEPAATGAAEAEGPLTFRLPVDVINLDPAFYTGDVEEFPGVRCLRGS